ncbi:MAG: DUF4468 domain-containing protein [Prevotella sp.]|nr:DUF4468 domain-containing protein [Prevotella sp.]
MKTLLMTMMLAICGASLTVEAQVMKAADLEKYAKSRYGDKWVDAAMTLAGDMKFDKNESLTYQEIIQAPGKTKQQLYVMLNYWVTATFKDKQAITLNDKEDGCIIISSTLDAIADHTGTLYRYIVNITPVIRIDIKDGKVRVTYTVQNYDVVKVESGGWLGGLTNTDSKDQNRNKDVYADGKRMNADKTDRRLYDEQWEIVRHYPFVEKDLQKRTCSKALVMTHAYSNAIMDKIEEAVKNGLIGNEDDNW